MNNQEISNYLEEQYEEVKKNLQEALEEID